MQLHGTPRSHFTRKIRILLAELDIPYAQVWTPSVLAADATAYGDNPLLRIPTLVDGDATIIESDHIARYLVAHRDPGDRLDVRSDAVDDLNRLAVANGVMANEVVLILAKRGGLEALDGVAYFRKLVQAIESGLAWLDARLDAGAGFDYGDIAMICMWQHLVEYETVPLALYPRLAARVAQFADRPSIADSTPAASVRRAVSEGWQA